MVKGQVRRNALWRKAANGGGAGGSIRPPGAQAESGIIMNTVRIVHTMM
jgi:hypothetical protein